MHRTDEALLPLVVTCIEGNAVGQILDRIAIEIDLEFVHAFGMVAGRGNRAGNRVTDIDHEHGACLATEHVEVRDVEADVLPGDR